ncbi:hypothetical protein ACV229_40205 [Burkholderia sp. MR1-5-21]
MKSDEDEIARHPGPDSPTTEHAIFPVSVGHAIFGARFHDERVNALSSAGSKTPKSQNCAVS